MTDATGETHLAVSRSSATLRPLNVLNTTLLLHEACMKDRQRTKVAQTTTERNPTPSGALPVPSSSTSSTNVPSSTNNSTFESSAAPDPQVPETFRSFVDQQRSLVTEDNTDDEPLFNTNTLPIRGGMGQTTRLPLLKLAEVL